MQMSNSEEPIYKMRISIWNTFPKFLLISLGIALVVMLFFCPSCFLSWEGIKMIFPDFLYSLAITMAMSFGGNVVENYFNNRISWIEHPMKRLIVTLVSYLTYAFLVSFIIVLFYAWVSGLISFDNIPWVNIASNATLPMYIALGFMALFTTRSWLLEWRKSALEAEILRNEKLSSQYQSLRDQLNPHFLFNSLNALSGLVYEDADRSAAFIQKLSKIYRYVLEVQEEELVDLTMEISFARNYLELQKIRFEESLQFNIEIDDQDGFLPPLSLQLVLENAIKHNILSEADPLFIHMYRKDNDLWVSNTFQPKLSQTEPSTGVGLSNIKMRYQLISKMDIEVIQTEDEFIVRLPILELST
ncbi:histidine kinase [Algoriphagus antarcticus]|uniref:Histidine kinase n=2 Tax=Algoriphagus antarcticus TaxID=238540 RepID=A0A3E0DX50_9BACT|nr:histidine kinase [Algoriphagus antarcticus]